MRQSAGCAANSTIGGEAGRGKARIGALPRVNSGAVVRLMSKMPVLKMYVSRGFAPGCFAGYRF